MKRDTIILVVVILLGTGITIACFKMMQPKIAYVNLDNLFAHFELKQQLQKKLQGEQAERQHLLDSLKLDLQEMKSSLESRQDLRYGDTLVKKYEARVNDFIEIEEQGEIANQTAVKKYDDQIIKQLTQYIRDFGDKYNYTYIISGRNDDIGYYESSADITNEVIDFANKKFRGYE